MTFYLVAFSIVIGSLLGVAVILARKFPQLTLIDTATLPKERENKKKKEIIHERVGRMSIDSWRRFCDRVGPFFGRIRAGFRAQYRRLLQLEKKFQEPATVPPTPTVAEVRESAAQLIAEASELLVLGKTPEAEKKYLEAIKLDQRNAEAYRGLGQIYLEAKNYSQAKETFEFLVRLSVKDQSAHGHAADHHRRTVPCSAPPAVQAEIAKSYFDLSNACRAMGDVAGAREALEGAVAHEPANPKHLDLLIEACILVGDKGRAMEVFGQLKAANPDNQKLQSLYDRIAAMPVGTVLKIPKKGK
ncbi:MAG: tetratricopeptide repeat protein [Patescibacteria group bacterium]|jgi:tetratricopeptide (TPR) repeat protein